MGTTVDKFEAAFETKNLIKSGINRLGGSLTNESTFRSYATVLENLYNEIPKVTNTGSNISLSPTRKGGLSITPLGKCEQDTTTGKNLLGLIDGTYENNGVTAIVSNGIITLNGTCTATSTLAINCYNYILDNNNYYTISANNPSNFNSDGTRLRFDTSGSYDLALTETNATKTITITSSHTPFNNKMQIRIENEFIYNDFVVKPQIELGSTATTYEPYTNGASPNPDYPQQVRVVTGDNKVIISEAHATIQGTITDSGEMQNNNYRIRTDYIEIKNYESIFASSNNLLIKVRGIYFYDENKNYMSRISQGQGYIIPYTFSPIPSTAKYFILVFQKSINTERIYPDGNYGATAQQTTTLHLGSNYLAGIGDYKDEIIGKTDDWKIKRKIQKLTLNGTRNWQRSSYAKTFYTNVSEGAYDDYEINCKSNLTKNFASSLTQFGNFDNGIVLQISTNNHYLAFMHGFDNFSVDDFKAWLNTTNLILYVKLSTPTEESITDTTLITDLNNMYQLSGYTGTTNMTITSNSANAQMEANISALKGE